MRTCAKRRVITLGETMVRLMAPDPGPLRHRHWLSVGIAGAEATVAVGLIRQGHECTYLTRLGDDEFSELIHRELRAEGLDVRARRVPGRRAGLLVREQRTVGTARVHYWRDGSAASTIAPTDLDNVRWKDFSALYLTGITPGLSHSAACAVESACDLAEQHGIPICFDVNYRSALWERRTAGETLSKIARRATVVFASADELSLADIDAEDPNVPNRHVVVTDGAEVVSATTHEGTVRVRPKRVSIADTVGAGDAFVAGYLAAWLDDAPAGQCVHRGIDTAAVAIGALGDWEGLPTRDELGLARATDGGVTR